MTKLELDALLRNDAVKRLMAFLEESYDTPIFEVGVGEVAFYTVDANQDDRVIKVKVSIPRGSRNPDGTYNEYDCQTESEMFHAEQEETRAKKEAIAKRKAEAQAKRKKKAEVSAS